jgi:hypothetical protein
MRHRLRSLSLLLLSGSLAACGATPLQPSIRDGIWVGATGEGERVQLTIAGDRIVLFSMRFLFPGPEFDCLATIPTPITVNVPIANDAFEFTIGGTGGFDNLSEMRISGRFESPTRLSGTYPSFTVADVCSQGEVVMGAGTFYANQ